MYMYVYRYYVCRIQPSQNFQSYVYVHVLMYMHVVHQCGTLS